ncbi:tail fiber assembly protein [Xenorhabdus miraniensis]|uniref:Tail fiber protein of a prophage n=1 Tax=Xenorhabdus miraniensis TaxID=351674 RepID=A0A2D0JQD9_9GAMM|nr:tail fiber assembly protein [Xenorhabdus miraniensis]PHM48560.1 tail fiber protein of a prophage [Xenorhabdus miraniensis]
MKYTTNIKITEFNEQGFATANGWIRVYRANTETGEYLCADMERTVMGVSLSAGAYLDEPEIPKSDNIAVCRHPDGQSWVHVPDYRGKTAYHIKTREPKAILQLGQLPPELTLLKPKTEFDVWNGKKWITDTTAQRQHGIQQAEIQCQSLLHDAEQQISLLERKKRLGVLTETEAILLREWEIYSVKLADIDCYAPDIHWPEQPK